MQGARSCLHALASWHAASDASVQVCVSCAAELQQHDCFNMAANAAPRALLQFMSRHPPPLTSPPPQDPQLGPAYQELLDLGLLDPRSLVILHILLHRCMHDSSPLKPWLDLLPTR
jgi:hypothetical protein